MIERRKFKRFPAKEQAFVEAFSRVGQIINISRGGLAFRYHADYGFRPGRSFQSGILLGPDFYLDDVSLTIISDLPLNVKDPAIIIERQCCVQFGALAPRCLRRLEYFIWRNTTILGTSLQLFRSKIKAIVSS